VQIYPNPVANFSTTYISTQNQIQFNNLSTIESGSIQAYDWSFGDGDTSDLSDPLHQYPDSGNYTCRLIVVSSFGCRDTVQQNVFQPLDVVSIESTPMLAIWPNPVNAEVNMKAATTDYFGIYNAIGELVLQPVFIGAGQTAIRDLSGLADGVYFVRPMKKPNDHSVKILIRK
jgi:hypothetical protein